MIVYTCDFCGHEAKFRFEADGKVAFIGTDRMYLYSHHLCEHCANKLGIKAMEEEGEIPGNTEEPETSRGSMVVI